MVESLKELNKICQKPHYKEKGNWMVRHFLRDAALPMTWLLLHTSVTAHQVTLISLIIGLIGACVFMIKATGAFLIACLLLQFWYYLDHVDGQIARYRKTVSLTGRFFDFITHHIIHGAIIFPLGFYASRITSNSFFAIWGFFASLAMMSFNLIYDTQYKTFFEKFQDMDKIETVKHPTSAGASQNHSKTSLSKKVFSFLHKSCEIHVMMNVLTLAAFLQWLLKTPDLRILLFLYYGIAAPAIAIIKTTYWIRSNRVDEEFSQDFRVTVKENQ